MDKEEGNQLKQELIDWAIKQPGEILFPTLEKAEKQGKITNENKKRLIKIWFRFKETQPQEDLIAYAQEIGLI